MTRAPKVAKPKAAKSKPQHASRPKHTRVYTAWHPVLVALIERVLPEGWYQCLSEFQLAREPLRIDALIVRKHKPGDPPRPRLLRSVLDDLTEHTIVHFKGPTDELGRDDARMLLAYALLYLVVADIDDPGQIALRVVASRLTPRFVASLRALGCELSGTVPGIHEGRLGVFPLRVVEAVPVNARAGEHLLYTVTPGMVADPGRIQPLDDEETDIFSALREHVMQIRHPLPGVRRREMKDADLVAESFDKAMAAVLARMPIETRLLGLTPEQVLRTYEPEQRLAGLTEAQAVLALPEPMLRALSKEYLATLPAATQAAIQKRLGGAAPPGRRRTRR